MVGDPKCVQHILRAYGSKYEKGMIAEQSSFLFGNGFPILENEPWRVRRNAVGPGLHRLAFFQPFCFVFSLSRAVVLVVFARRAACINSERENVDERFFSSPLSFFLSFLEDLRVAELLRKWIASLIETAFKPCTLEMISKLKAESAAEPVNLEALFSQLSLDIIGCALCFSRLSF